MKRILFLDIDGVMWTGKHAREIENHAEDAHMRMNEFCPKAVEQLNRILDKFDNLHIVISSSWRMGHTTEWLQDHFDNQGVDSSRIIGVTPHVPNGCRGDEIQKWLSNTPVDDFVIVDDDSDMGALSNKLVKTNFYAGLTKDKADEIIRRLKDGNTG